MALRAAVCRGGAPWLLAAAGLSGPRRCLRWTSVTAVGTAGGDLHKLSHGVDGLDLWAAEIDDGRDPRAAGGHRVAFSEVFAFLEERGVLFSDVAEWKEAKRRALLDQVFPSDPLAAHSALQEWAERLEQGRLKPVNDAPQRSNEGYQLWRLESAAAAGDAEQVKKTLVVLVRGLGLEMPQLARPFAEVCKSGRLSKEVRAEIAVHLEQLYADEQSVRFDLRMYTSTLLTCKDYTAVRALFRRMRQQGIVPDAFAYSAAMKASEDSPDAVVNLFDNLQRAALQPTERHFAVLLRSLGFALTRAAAAQQEKGGGDEGAVAAARQRLWDAWRLLKSKTRPSPHSYAIMVRSVASELEWVRALFPQLEDGRPESLGRPLVDSEVRALAAVEELVAEAVRTGVATNRLFAYHVTAQPTLRGRLDGLARYLAHLKDNGKRLDVPRQVIRAVGNHRRAQEVVQEFAQGCPRENAACAVWVSGPGGRGDTEHPLEEWVIDPERTRHPERQPKATEDGSACETLWALMEEAEASYDRQRAPPSPS